MKILWRSDKDKERKINSSVQEITTNQRILEAMRNRFFGVSYGCRALLQVAIQSRMIFQNCLTWLMKFEGSLKDADQNGLEK